MNADAQARPPGAELLPPWDLTEWFDQSTLEGWIHEEVETLDWGNPELIDHLQAHPSFRPKMLLNLLTFAYATAVSESDEIARRCYVDPAFRAICGSNPPPSPNSLIHFRRENRGLLKWCLAQTFKRALRERLGDSQLPAGVRRRLDEAAVRRLDLARHMDRGASGD